MNNIFSGNGRANHEIQAADRFDEWAIKYGEDRISPWFLNNQKLAISRLNISNDGNFLDVGCGTGSALRFASPLIKKYKACGIDISSKMVEKARLLSQTNNNIEIVVGSAEQIPYPTSYFKYLICTCSFHHYQSPNNALKEIKRVMSSDGKLILIDSGRDVFLPIWLQDQFRQLFEKSHVRYYSTKEMFHLVTNAGLSFACKMETIKKILLHKKVFTGLFVCEIIKSHE